MPDTPETAPLSGERLTEIRATSGDTRCRNPYVTEYGVAADVVEELLAHLAHLAARDAEVLRALEGLLTNVERLPDDSSFDEGLATAYDTLNHLIRAAIAALRLSPATPEPPAAALAGRG